ncbi:MAG TPA: TonB-dependent receptor [Bacteroidales bacterium]|nr:TonB-dependent receptor [Bacteroidales bacterium]
MKINIKIIIFSLFMLLQTLMAVASRNEGEVKKLTVSGHILDAKTGEMLIGATVFITENQCGTSSNVYGFYALSLPAGQYTLTYSYIGYQTQQREVLLDNDRTLDVRLVPSDQQLDEVVISGERIDRNVRAAEMSVVRMETKTISQIPALFGETDVIRALQLLPGVKTVSEGSTGFSVRGGSTDQNLVLLDEATVYNSGHLLGFFSVFNNDAVKDVKLYKGDIPPAYGGRLSSLLDVRMKDGNNQKFAATGGIGIISSRLTLEGPIVNENTSFIVSGRRTYADLFIPLLGKDNLRGSKLFFWDLNAKISHTFNENNRVFASAYLGRDVFKNEFAGMNMGNGTFTVRWNHLFSKKLFSNFTLLRSRYDYSLGTAEGEVTSFEWKSELVDYRGKADFTWFLNTDNTIRFGASLIHHTFSPGEARGIGDETFLTSYDIPSKFAYESGIYVSNEQKIGALLTLKYGLRFSMFQNVGADTLYHFDEDYNIIEREPIAAGKVYNTFTHLEPRVGFVYLLSERASVKGSYSRTIQYLQLGQNSTAGTPLDIWFPASPNVKPQISDQGALGYFRNFDNNMFEASAEVYYKNMQNTIDFKDHAQLLLNRELEAELRFGRSWAYGLELMVRKQHGKLTGWVSYTLSKTERKIEEINNGKKYVAPYDKPNDISIVINYDISQRWTAGLNWVYSTGLPVTFPTGRAVWGGVVVPIYSDRNDYRMPDYHRLDLSVTLRPRKNPDRKWYGEWNFSVYNAYGRKNPWSINFVQETAGGDYQTYAEMTYLFSVIPSISYNFKF